MIVLVVAGRRIVAGPLVVLVGRHVAFGAGVGKGRLEEKEAVVGGV